MSLMPSTTAVISLSPSTAFSDVPCPEASNHRFDVVWIWLEDGREEQFDFSPLNVLKTPGVSMSLLLRRYSGQPLL